MAHFWLAAPRHPEAWRLVKNIRPAGSEGETGRRAEKVHDLPLKTEFVKKA